MWYAAELDIPEEWWQPTATPEMVDEVIQNTLQSTSAFIKAIFPSYCDPLPPTHGQIWQSCYQNYQAFEKELDKPHVKWNISVRKKIHEIIDSRMHPHRILSKCVLIHSERMCRSASRSTFRDTIAKSRWYPLHMGNNMVLEMAKCSSVSLDLQPASLGPLLCHWPQQTSPADKENSCRTQR